MKYKTVTEVNNALLGYFEQLSLGELTPNVSNAMANLIGKVILNSTRAMEYGKNKGKPYSVDYFETVLDKDKENE